MRFGTKILGLLASIAVLPILVAWLLVEQALETGAQIALERREELSSAYERAGRVYRQLFDAQKEQYHASAVAIAATWNGHIDDPRARLIRRWRVVPDGPSGDDVASFPDDKWRGLVVPAQPLRDGRSLEIEFVAPREWFDEYEAIGAMTLQPQLSAIERREHNVYHFILVGAFTAAMIPVMLVGVMMARRTTRRLDRLAAAAREVGGGNLAVRLPIEGSDEIAALGVAFNEMVGELKESRNQIAYLEKIGAWQEVARRLAHEIKNPLTPIQLAMQQLHRKYEGGDDAFGKLLDDANEIVQEEVGALRRLVGDFSAFAKLPSVEAAALDLAELVADAVRGRSDWEGSVTALPLGEPILVRADKQLLKQALTNLIENSLQAGAKTVEVRAEKGAQASGSFARILIDDDGPGVPSELRERIFDPYFTTKKAGTGLGLSIVKKIALEHGGDVFVEPSPRKGARFSIRLPLG